MEEIRLGQGVFDPRKTRMPSRIFSTNGATVALDPGINIVMVSMSSYARLPN